MKKIYASLQLILTLVMSLYSLLPSAHFMLVISQWLILCCSVMLYARLDAVIEMYYRTQMAPDPMLTDYKLQ